MHALRLEQPRDGTSQLAEPDDQRGPAVKDVAPATHGGLRGLDMLVGDLQRVIEYPKLGFAVEQEIPEDVHAAYERLIRAGFTSRLLPPPPR
ncbi:hypothetical protein G3I47_03260 [Streptomyces anulatus]|nr:hypothetical protein [Streptomyces anulatus]